MKDHNKILANYYIQDLKEGQEFSFVEKISKENVNEFSDLSGDSNPLHLQDNFAKQRGFDGRIVHGGLLISYLSRLVGVHLPGKNGLLERISLNFHSPAYINDTVKITGVVSQISLGTNTIVLNVRIDNESNHILLAKGKIHVGFTKEID